MSAKTTGEEEATPDYSQRSYHSSQNEGEVVDQDELVRLHSQLQLPRFNPDGPPSLRILAVADIDLTSAAALAEYALRNDKLGGGNVDMCIACGPFVRDEDVRKRYLQGRRSRDRHNAPHERTREQTAALEGIMSGAISQLESIVCRVVYCPHPTDPSTTLKNSLRLTPNSVNLHQRWLPLAPGIGCCAHAGIKKDQASLGGPDAVRVQHGPEYTNSLRGLLELAPPTSSTPQSRRNDILFSSHTLQAILVSQMEALAPCSSTNNNTMDAAWPKDYLQFVDSPNAQSQVCLAVVAAGMAPSKLDMQRGNVRLLAPGSLRQHGDFCLVDVGLSKDDSSKYKWKVDRVEFGNMNRE